MNFNYWKIAATSLWILIGILCLAIITKVRMFILLSEFLGATIGLFIAGLVVYELFKMCRKPNIPNEKLKETHPIIETRGSYTPTDPMVPPPKPPAKKRVRKAKSFKAPKL